MAVVLILWSLLGLLQGGGVCLFNSSLTDTSNETTSTPTVTSPPTYAKQANEHVTEQSETANERRAKISEHTESIQEPNENVSNHGGIVMEPAFRRDATKPRETEFPSDVTNNAQATETERDSYPVQASTMDIKIDTLSMPMPMTTTPSSAKKDACDVMLCDRTSGRYVVNSSVCTDNNGFMFDASNVSSLEIWSDPSDAPDGNRVCRWTVTVPYQSRVHVLIGQPDRDFKGSSTLSFTEEARENGRSQVLGDENVLHQEEVRNSNLRFLSIIKWFNVPTISINHYFRGVVRNKTHVFTITYEVERGHFFSKLPNARFSDSRGYVISPGFDSDEQYPNNYDGVFELNFGPNESAMIIFEQFLTASYDPYMCMYSDYLKFTNLFGGINKFMCGYGLKSDLVQVFHSSFHLRFHTDSSYVRAGFKMMYVVVPKSEEPLLSADGRVNCSVPHYHKFEPLLACNMQSECLGGEDEQNCSYRTQACGPDAMDVGTKCFTVASRPEKLTWYSAKEKCTKQKGSLPTFRTSEEFRQFKSVITKQRLDLDAYVGAQVLERRLSVSVSHMYKRVWQWTDGTTAFSLHSLEVSYRPACAWYKYSDSVDLRQVECDDQFDVVLVCEFEKPDAKLHQGTTIDRNGNTNEADPRTHLWSRTSLGPSTVNPETPDPSNGVWNVSMTDCPSGHVTRDFLSCDRQAKCHEAPDTSCSTGGVTVPMFRCQRSGMSLSFTLVCDHVRHCPDNSDEDFCHHPTCPTGFDKCQNGQCFRDVQRCDDKLNCYDGRDEESCWKMPFTFEIKRVYPPGLIHIDSEGLYFERVDGHFDCPDSHFQCPRGFCLPVYFRCNGVDDCPGREDEVGCDNYACPGLYRCHGSTVCVHADDICDGVPQCPRQDDELLCEPTCIQGCRCTGLAFVCTARLPAGSYPSVRYLDASGSGMTLTDVNGSLYVIRLRLSRCRIRSVPRNLTLPNLSHLDLSWNQLTHLDTHLFAQLINLRVLLLTGNPLTRISFSGPLGPRPTKLKYIDLAHTRLETYDGRAFNNTPNLNTLNLSWSMMTTIPEDGFQTTPLLKIVDLRGCPLERYPNDLLTNLFFLHIVRADDYKLCCQAMLPADFDTKNCHAPQDLLASCDDLLRSNAYRVFLWTLASLSLAGNAGSLGARLYLHRQGDTLGSFGVFVINLSVADFFMGVYLAIVGVADRIYQGRYLWHDDEWKKSAACKTAGFLSLLSSEVSALMICLITLDRFLALSFPFRRLRFGRRSALLACGVVWMAGTALATVPLLPMTSHWSFYSQTGICSPLPFTNGERFEGYKYSFGIMIVLNLALFLLIAVGQAAIYWSVYVGSMPSSFTTRTRDAAIARRLTTVVVSDFLCWFPVGLLGLLAATGTPIPGELNVAVAVFVLPFNSALNPFLYTFNVLTEKRRRAQESALRKRWESGVQIELSEAATRQKREPGSKAAAIELIQMLGRKWELAPQDFLP